MSEANIKAKQAVVDEIKEKLTTAKSAVIIDYLGTSVAEADAMRRKLREVDVDYKVYKNTLLKRAFDGSDFEELMQVLSGSSALAISYDDPTAPARVLNGVMKEYKKMEFKAGYIEGTFYDAEGIKTIAAIPSREELIAKFMGSIQSPVGKFVRTLQAIADDKTDGTEEAAPAEAEAPADGPEADAKAEAPATDAPAEDAKEEAVPAAETAEATDEPAEAPTEAADESAEAPAEAAEAEAPAEEAQAEEDKE